MAVTRDRSHRTSDQPEPHCGTEGDLWVATIAIVTHDPVTILMDEPPKDTVDDQRGTELCMPAMNPWG